VAAPAERWMDYIELASIPLQTTSNHLVLLLAEQTLYIFADTFWLGT
jgi:hypothetical protein